MSKKVVSVAVILVISALALWFWRAQTGKNESSNPHPSAVAENQSSANNSANNNTPSGKLDSVNSMVDGLRRRLEAEPNDMKGWVLLSKSYHHLQRWEEASEAMAKAKALGYKGEAAPTPNTSVEGKSIHSTRPGSTSSTDRQMSEIMRDVIKDKDSADASATDTSTIDNSGVTLKIALAPALQDKFAADTAVFIFARSTDQPPGPPLAVIRKQVRDLPLQIVLNDGMAMMPGRTISSVSQIIVGVRVSTSGSPAAQPGDYQALSDKIPSSYNSVLELTIKDAFGG